MATTMVTRITRAARMSAPGRDQETAKQARRAAIVMAGTMILWMGAQVVGRDMGWPDTYALLFDLAALAGFIWSLAVTYQIWRKRRG